MIELDLLVSEEGVIVASLQSPPLLPAAGEAVSLSVVIVVYSSFLNTVALTVLSSFRMGHKPKRTYLSNKEAMLVNCIKHLFVVRLFRNNEHPFNIYHFPLIYCISLLSY